MKTRTAFGLIAALGFACGCSSGNGETNENSNGQSSESDAGIDAQGQTDASADAPQIETSSADGAACQGSVIPTSIATSMTLNTACSPWQLTGVTIVGNPATGATSPVLTIEPGVTVLAAAGSALIVGYNGMNTGAGGLQAVGTSAAPIVFKSSAVTPQSGSWEGIVLGDATVPTSQLSYVEIDEAGGASTLGVPNLPQAALTIGEATSQVLALSLSHLTFAENGGDGLLMLGANVGFGPGSGNLTISDFPTGSFPIALHANQASTLTGVSFSSGSTSQDGHVELIDTSGNGLELVNSTQTWPVIPIPYDVVNPGLDIEKNGSTATTLTIAGPNTVMFSSSAEGLATTGIFVDQVGQGGATLVASNVTFSSDLSSPTPGAWGGIYFNITADSLSSVTGCTFQYAGYMTSWSTGESCTGVVFVDDRANGGEVLMGPVVTGNTFSNYVGDAIFLGLPPQPSPGGGLSNQAAYDNNTFTTGQTVCMD